MINLWFYIICRYDLWSDLLVPGVCGFGKEENNFVIFINFPHSLTAQNPLKNFSILEMKIWKLAYMYLN